MFVLKSKRKNCAATCVRWLCSGLLENLCDGERTYEKTIVGVEFFY